MHSKYGSMPFGLVQLPVDSGKRKLCCFDRSLSFGRSIDSNPLPLFSKDDISDFIFPF